MSGAQDFFLCAFAFCLLFPFLSFTLAHRCAMISAIITFTQGNTMPHKMIRDCRGFYIYVVLSKTPTKVGSAIRKLAGIKYNHASIAFDRELIQLYSFARRQYKNPLDAGLVREHPEWFSLRRHNRVDVRIYKIPVTREQYLKGKTRILEIKHDSDGYLYNLFSVLFFPFMKGFETYKAYSCAEFVAHMIRTMGIELSPNKLDCMFTPQDIGERIGQLADV